MHDVSYFRPEKLDQAVEFLKDHQEATLWAGGTDLVIQLENKRLKISEIIDLKSINELRFIEAGNPIRIGSMTTIHDLESSDLIKKEFPVLAQAAHALGSWQIRTLATVGGNVSNAAPSAETASPILILDGKMVVETKEGEKEIPAEQFFKGPGQTVLKQDEILKEIRLSKLPEGFKSIYLKHSLRRSMDIALVSVACALETEGDKCTEIRLGLGAVAPVPMRAENAEKMLSGQMLTEELIEEASSAAAAECHPIDDIRATAGYRRELVQVLVRRALTSLWKAGESK